MRWNSEQIIWLILLLNLIIALLYMLVMWLKVRMPFVIQRGFIMILCPGMGLFCYLFSYLLSLLFRNQEMDYDNLSMDKTKKEFLQMVDKERELETLPMEEVLTVSVEKDRRRAMLNMLKMDVSEKLNLMRKAVENEDSETSHYAAAALTDEFNKFNLELNDLQVKYDNDRTDEKGNMEFMDAVVRILKSGGLLGVEETKYDYMFMNLFYNLEKNHPDSITEEYYEMMVKALQKMGKTAEAEKWAEISLERQPDNEQSYLNVLFMKYILGKEEDFREVLDKLIKSNISLSNKGLDIVRFWLKK